MHLFQDLYSYSGPVFTPRDVNLFYLIRCILRPQVSQNCTSIRPETCLCFVLLESSMTTILFGNIQ
ncbi:hypothetical protein BABINDRAFT_118571 [Babjeviella inositovora NRRL Y-12698]|uniref:Uncharacterized protein n=1 Tax=Babjeviella inositovora NRRL Y-12698 TaxID=984486 RepID=A0A1E3QTF7_9ASCO|nr:uncharacterized protein BABINDRAFT_118571 [Babjeviella inositovora NRRL Y-12698]ODQ80961.1 hypothetical protein BABINDRAFT_118571 [Babjeviella inositovora NRRL Y-12698]